MGAMPAGAAAALAELCVVVEVEVVDEVVLVVVGVVEVEDAEVAGDDPHAASPTAAASARTGPRVRGRAARAGECGGAWTAKVAGACAERPIG